MSPAARSGRSEDVTVIGELERERNLLLGHQYRDAMLPQPPSAVYASAASFGASPVVGSSSIKSLGSDISARPTASICCCPPLNVPAR